MVTSLLDITAWSKTTKPIIGMIHLMPLPGAPRYGGNLAAIRDAALRDAEALAEGGIHGLMLENFGDVPFYPDRVPAQVVSHMTRIALEIRKRIDLPLGINVLRNAGRSALAIAHAADAQFIRVNVLCGARVADQGILQGIAHDLLRDRASLKAESIKILADVDVKHSAPLAPRAIADEVEDTIHRGLADAIIVTGSGTGKTTDLDKLRTVKAAAGATPVMVGSGVDAQTIAAYLPFCDGFIIGTTFKKDGIASNPVDTGRVRELIAHIPH